MSEQQVLFKGNRIENIHLHTTITAIPESKTVSSTVKLTDSLKKMIQEFCFAHDVSFSEFLRDAACFYHDFYSVSPKLIKYQVAVKSMLEKLP
jgi:hypothetical protein